MLWDRLHAAPLSSIEAPPEGSVPAPAVLSLRKEPIHKAEDGGVLGNHVGGARGGCGRGACFSLLSLAAGLAAALLCGSLCRPRSRHCFKRVALRLQPLLAVAVAGEVGRFVVPAAPLVPRQRPVHAGRCRLCTDAAGVHVPWCAGALPAVGGGLEVAAAATTVVQVQRGALVLCKGWRVGVGGAT